MSSVEFPIIGKFGGVKILKEQMMTKRILVLLGAGIVFGASAARALPPLQNGNMADGEGKPAHWDGQWVASGKISVARDAAVFHSDPASMRVESVGGAAHGQAQQNVDVSGGGKFHAEAWLMADGGATALFGIQTYDANWKGISFSPLGNALSGFDWQNAKGDVEIPVGAAHLGYVCMIEGSGRAWFDDVAISEVGLPVASVASAKSPTKPSPQKQNQPAESAPAPPKPANAWSPGEGFYKDYPQAWKNFANDEIKRAKEGGGDVVFIGDSLTLGFKEQPLWKERYEPLKAVNFGVGGDGTPQVLWRIGHGILDGFSAKLIVLMIGINNTWPGFSADDSIKGIGACVAAIRAKQPAAKILLLGVLPIFDKDDGVRTTIKKINAGIAKLDDGKTVRFLDFGDKFLDADGARKKELYRDDRLHINEAGYKIWADAMEPLFREMLNK